MNAQKPDNDRLAYHVGSLNLSGLTMTKVILWLAAITIVSFVIGFGTPCHFRGTAIVLREGIALPADCPSHPEHYHHPS